MIGYACRNIYCKQYKMKKIKKHDLWKNNSGSLKPIEADMAVELVLKNDDLVRAKCRIKTLIGDDDSSSIAGLRRLSPYAIRKWSNSIMFQKRTILNCMTWNWMLLWEYSKVFNTLRKKNIRIKEYFFDSNKWLSWMVPNKYFFRSKKYFYCL